VPGDTRLLDRGAPLSAGGAHARAVSPAAAMLAVQVALGIATLVYVVPVPLAAAHQAGALLLLTLALLLNHALRAGESS